MTGGNPQGLARAEREIGLESWSISLQRIFPEYDADEVQSIQDIGPLRIELARWPILWRALRHFDVVHFNFGQSIMPVWNASRAPALKRYSWLTRQMYGSYARFFELKDLPILKRAGKGIVVTYQGDDARQGDYCRKNFEINVAEEVEPTYYLPESDWRKRRRIERMARYADRIYALNPDLMYILPKNTEFLPYAHIDLRTWKPPPDKPLAARPLVMHAPSHRRVKGTRFLLDAVHRLKNEGVDFDFQLIENLSHSEARKQYEQADLLVDQLLVGWYGATSAELMALGKPVICYIREQDLGFVPAKMREELPIINATPGTIYQVLKEWLTIRRNDLCEQGRLSRRYVERWHNPLQIAEKLRDAYVSIVGRRS